MFHVEQIEIDKKCSTIRFHAPLQALSGCLEAAQAYQEPSRARE